MHGLYLIICLLVPVCFTGGLFASDTLYIDRDFRNAYGADYAWIYEDKKQDEELQTILNRTFLDYSKPYLNFGFSSSAYWLKFVLKNRDVLPQEIYYKYLNHYIDYVDIYLVDDMDSLLTVMSLGAQRLDPTYKSFKMNPVYNLTIPPGAYISMYLRIQSDTPLRMPVFFNSSDSMLKRERKRHVFFGFFYGISCFTVVLVLAIILITHDRMYFYFLMALLGLILYMIAFDNFPPRWVIADRPAFILHITTSLSVLVGLFYVLFMQRFFSQEKAPAVVSSIFSILKILSIIFFAWYLIDFYSGNKVAYFFLPLLMMTLLAISILYWLAGAKLARFFFWALLIPVAGVLLQALSNAGVIYSHVLTVYSMKAAYMLQNIVFIIAIADRYLLMQQHFTGLLQEKVVERTLKLEEALDRLKYTQQQLVHSEKMASLGTLTSGIAHEVNNPLNAISGGIYMLEEDPDHPQTKATALSMIREGFDKTHKIIKALMTFSGSEEAEPVEIDLQEIIDNTVLFVRSRLGDEIQVETDYRVKQTVPAVPEKLHQVLLSVIDNAIFAIRHKQELGKEFIRICTWEEKGKTPEESRAVIEICNSGPAIPDQILSKVFDPFFTTKDPAEGTGLGLSITYSLVQDHNGSIEVHNVPDGVCFVIKLPLSLKS